MSTRDMQLLHLIELPTAEVAKLIDRSRQAVHAGLKRAEDYFSSTHLIAILGHLQRKDDARFYKLVGFVDANYDEQHPSVDKNLVLPGRIGASQLLRVSVGAKRIHTLFNLNKSHLAPTSLFVDTIKRLLQANRAVSHFILPELSMMQTTEDLGLIPQSRSVHIGSVVDIPTVLLDFSSTRRSFGFTRNSVEEFEIRDSERLWELANSLDTLPDGSKRALLRWDNLREKNSAHNISNRNP